MLMTSAPFFTDDYGSREDGSRTPRKGSVCRSFWKGPQRRAEWIPPWNEIAVGLTSDLLMMSFSSITLHRHGLGKIVDATLAKRRNDLALCTKTIINPAVLKVLAHSGDISVSLSKWSGTLAAEITALSQNSIEPTHLPRSGWINVLFGKYADHFVIEAMFLCMMLHLQIAVSLESCPLSQPSNAKFLGPK